MLHTREVTLAVLLLQLCTVLLADTSREAWHEAHCPQETVPLLLAPTVVQLLHDEHAAAGGVLGRSDALADTGL